MKKPRLVVITITKKHRINECNVSELFVKNIGDTALYFIGLKLATGESHLVAKNAVIDLDKEMNFLEGKQPKAYISYIQYPNTLCTE